MSLARSYKENNKDIEHTHDYEIGIDEAGRGPLFGRVYVASVILPYLDQNFDYSLLKDSKKFHSKKKMQQVCEYIKENAIDWSITWKDSIAIDRENILSCTIQCMHESALNIVCKCKNKNALLLVDGSYFRNLYVRSDYSKTTIATPLLLEENTEMHEVPHVLITKGDNTYASIAAASILAKCARDDYIDDLCNRHPYLDEHYGISSNKGYGTKQHLDGIEKYGITQWHRKSFNRCCPI